MHFYHIKRKIIVFFALRKWSYKDPDLRMKFRIKRRDITRIIKRLNFDLTVFIVSIDEATKAFIKLGEAIKSINIEGNEWDDINDCNFDEYLVLELLPTEEETYKLWIQSLKEK